MKLNISRGNDLKCDGQERTRAGQRETDHRDGIRLFRGDARTSECQYCADEHHDDDDGVKLEAIFHEKNQKNSDGIIAIDLPARGEAPKKAEPL